MIVSDEKPGTATFPPKSDCKGTEMKLCCDLLNWAALPTSHGFASDHSTAFRLAGSEAGTLIFGSVPSDVLKGTLTTGMILALGDMVALPRSTSAARTHSSLPLFSSWFQRQQPRKLASHGLMPSLLKNEQERQQSRVRNQEQGESAPAAGQMRAQGRETTHLGVLYVCVTTVSPMTQSSIAE
jgi:hypothetical protein